MSAKTALITGAGRGIGRAIALALAEAGASVSLTARTPGEIEEVATEARRRYGVQALAIPGDQTKTADVEQVVKLTEERLGAVEILVNNAGQSIDRPFLDMDEAAALTLIDVNLMGPIRYLKAVGRVMIGRRRGKVINIASVNAFKGARNLSIYCATKGGILQLTKALAGEWAHYGVRVNAICPGYIRTSMTKAALEDEYLRTVVTRRIPLRRVGDPSDLAVMAVYLASDASDFVTGATFVVDGGELAV